MNILSVDFDYFQKMDPYTAILWFPYPGDGSITDALAEWSKLCQNEKALKEINTVSVMDAEFKKMCSVLDRVGGLRPNIPVLVVNSHVNIYDFVKEHVLDTDEDVNIINADMHHDVYGKNNEVVDCGNWGNMLKRDYPNLKITWLKNSITSDIYADFTISKTDGFENLTDQTIDTAVLDSYDFDMIFICRSDLYVPPHMDKYFSDICGICDHRFNNLILEDRVNIERDIDEMIKHSNDMINEKFVELFGQEDA